MAPGPANDGQELEQTPSPETAAPSPETSGSRHRREVPLCRSARMSVFKYLLSRVHLVVMGTGSFPAPRHAEQQEEEKEQEEDLNLAE